MLKNQYQTNTSIFLELFKSLYFWNYYVIMFSLSNYIE
jgi:hypothetical protein